MKASRTKNSSRNIFWGLINKIIGIIMPFLMRTLIIYILGIQYAGLNSLFTSVLGMLSLAELGIGSALTFSMYEPAANDDYSQLSALLNFYKKCYREIGIIISVIGIIIVPFIPKLIEGGYPNDINIYVLYGIYLFNSVISYFMYAYRGSILVAYQRNDIQSNIATIMQLVQYGFQIILLLVFQDYYAYIVVTPFISVGTNILTAIYSKKMFPQIKCVGEIDRQKKSDISQKVKGMIYQKIGGVVLSSVDNIVISAFLGLTLLGIYNNYYMVITAIFGILSVVMNSIIPSIGNAINEKSIEDNYMDFRKFNFVYYWIVTWFASCMIGLYQPFIRIWIGEKYLVSNGLMILFVVYFFIHKWMDMGYVYQEATGMWWETRYVPIIAAVINLLVNIILVQIIGLAGILISTIISVLFVYNTGYIYIIFKNYFRKPIKPYAISQVKYAIGALLTIGMTYCICANIHFDGIISILEKVIVCAVLPNIFMILLWNKSVEFKSIYGMLKRLCRKK